MGLHQPGEDVISTEHNSYSSKKKNKMRDLTVSCWWVISVSGLSFRRFGTATECCHKLLKMTKRKLTWELRCDDICGFWRWGEWNEFERFESRFASAEFEGSFTVGVKLQSKRAVELLGMRNDVKFRMGSNFYSICILMEFETTRLWHRFDLHWEKRSEVRWLKSSTVPRVSCK